MAIGMTVDYGLLIHRTFFILALSLGLLLIKVLVNYFDGRRRSRCHEI